jgi:hypothetical protein
MCFVSCEQMPEVVFRASGTDEAFHVLVNPKQKFIQRWGVLQVNPNPGGLVAKKNMTSKTQNCSVKFIIHKNN